MKRLILYSLLSIFLLLVSGCADQTGVTTPQGKDALTQKTDKASPTEISCTIQRISSNGAQLEVVSAKVPFEKSKEYSALNYLITAPENKSFINPLNKAKVKLLSVDVDNKGLAKVNLSREILSLKGNSSLFEMLVIGSIVNTLTEFPEVKEVQILVEGKIIETLTGHLDLSEPVKRNDTLLQKL